LANFHWLGWIAVAAGIVSVWLASKVVVNEVAARPSSKRSIIASPLNLQPTTENLK
jgi:hypothetical protein